MADSEKEQTPGSPKPGEGVAPSSGHNNPPNGANGAEKVEMGDTEESQKED